MDWLLKLSRLGLFSGQLASYFRIKFKIVPSRLLQLLLLGLALLLLQTSIIAAPFVTNPLAPPDTSSPQGTIESFVENVNESHRILMAAYDLYQKDPGLFPSPLVRKQVKQAEFFFDRAERCLDLREIPSRLKSEKAAEGTLLLKEILDRIEMLPYTEIPDALAVANNKELSRWTIPHTEIDLLKVEEGARAGEFLFSPDTVAHLKQYYKKVNYLPYQPGATEGFYQLFISSPGRLLPLKWFQNMPNWLNTMYWDQTLWQWISLGSLLTIAIFLSHRSFHWSRKKAATLDPPQRIWAMLPFPIITVAAVSMVGYFLDWWLKITGNLYLIVSTILGIIFWILITLTIFLVGNILAETIIASPKINSKSLDASLIKTVFQLLNLICGTIALVFGISRIGISLVPILASLGVGGLALALAARPTLENIIAGLILFMDRPVSVGDFCCFGNKIGTIEEIGLRSTRIRGIDRTLTSVPNADFSQKELVNYSKRDRFLLKTIIGLRYETNSEQLRFVLTKLREMLLAHPKLLEQFGRVRFVDYGNYSLDVEIFIYVDTIDHSEFLGIKEDVFLRIKDIVNVAGTDFAFPSQTTYIAQDSGLDPQRSQAVEAVVRNWRSQGILPFPEFTNEQRQKLRDTLDFPPKGSVNEHSISDKQ